MERPTRPIRIRGIMRGGTSGSLLPLHAGKTPECEAPSRVARTAVAREMSEVEPAKLTGRTLTHSRHSVVGSRAAASRTPGALRTRCQVATTLGLRAWRSQA